MPSNKVTILIVEDEPAITELISFTVKSAGWLPVAARTTAEAWDAMLVQRPGLILLDWMLPDKSGLQLLSRVRADYHFNDVPVIMLTAKGLEEDKVAGLDRGADDYVTKPFSPRELTARINALLRRKSPEQGTEVLKAGPVILDQAACTVSLHGKYVEMGPAEFKLLRFFMAHPNRVFSRSQLLDKVWGQDVVIEERTVDVHVLRLRKALKGMESLIKTVRSVGYMFSER